MEEDKNNKIDIIEEILTENKNAINYMDNKKKKECPPNFKKINWVDSDLCDNLYVKICKQRGCNEISYNCTELEKITSQYDKMNFYLNECNNKEAQYSVLYCICNYVYSIIDCFKFEKSSIALAIFMALCKLNNIDMQINDTDKVEIFSKLSSKNITPILFFNTICKFL